MPQASSLTPCYTSRANASRESAESLLFTPPRGHAVMWTWITRRLGPNLWQATRQWNEDDGQMLAASLAYYSVLSLFPLLIVLIAGLGFVLRFSDEAQRTQ